MKRSLCVLLMTTLMATSIFSACAKKTEITVEDETTKKQTQAATTEELTTEEPTTEEPTTEEPTAWEPIAIDETNFPGEKF